MFINKRKVFLFSCLLLIGLFVRLPKYNTLYYDEANYASIVKNFFHYQTLLPTRNIATRTISIHRILFYYLQAIFYFLFGFNDCALRILPLISSIIIIPISYLISKKIGMKNPFLPTIIITFSAYIRYYTSIVMSDGLFTLIVMIYALLYLMNKNPLILQALAFISLFIRYEGIFLFIPTLISFDKKIRINTKQLLITLLFFIMFLSFFIIIFLNSLIHSITYYSSLIINSFMKNTFNFSWNYFYAINPLIFILFIITIIKHRKKTEIKKLIFVILPFMLFAFLITDTIRRIVYVTPLIILLSFYSLDVFLEKKHNKSTLLFLFTFLIALSVMVQDYETNYDYLLSPSFFVKNYSHENSIILAQSGPVISYYSDRNYYLATYSSLNDFKNYLNDSNVLYIVLTPKLEKLSEEKQNLIISKDLIYLQTNTHVKVLKN